MRNSFADSKAAAAAFMHDSQGRCIHIWSVQVDPGRITNDLLRPSTDLLSTDERARAARFRFDTLQRSFTATRAALRIVLALYLGRTPQSLEFTYGPNGKPAICGGGNLEFNASHSGNLAVFAITRTVAVGVDVEQQRDFDNMEGIARRFFCATEADELMSLPQPQREHAFFRCWTRKEAYIKATGIGLSAALDSFRVSLEPRQPAQFIHIHGSTTAAKKWALHDLELASGYAAALAYHDIERPIIICPQLHAEELLQS